MLLNELIDRDVNEVILNSEISAGSINSESLFVIDEDYFGEELVFEFFEDRFLWVLGRESLRRVVIVVLGKRDEVQQDLLGFFVLQGELFLLLFT